MITPKRTKHQCKNTLTITEPSKRNIRTVLRGLSGNYRHGATCVFLVT